MRERLVARLGDGRLFTSFFSETHLPTCHLRNRTESSAPSSRRLRPCSTRASVTKVHSKSGLESHHISEFDVRSSGSRTSNATHKKCSCGGGTIDERGVRAAPWCSVRCRRWRAARRWSMHRGCFSVRPAARVSYSTSKKARPVCLTLMAHRRRSRWSCRFRPHRGREGELRLKAGLYGGIPTCTSADELERSHCPAPAAAAAAPPHHTTTPPFPPPRPRSTSESTRCRSVQPSHLSLGRAEPTVCLFTDGSFGHGDELPQLDAYGGIRLRGSGLLRRWALSAADTCEIVSRLTISLSAIDSTYNIAWHVMVYQYLLCLVGLSLDTRSC